MVQRSPQEDRAAATWATSESSASWAEAGWVSSTRRSRCRLGRRVALKVLQDSAALDPRRLRRFQVEAQAAASLRHPHIVPVFATGSEDGIAYYAMQYIECRDLARIIDELRQDDGTEANRVERRKIARRKPLFDQGTSFERDVARLAQQAAMALEHAHANDVLHRDVKPSNLLIDEKGHLWITDFGLARISGGVDLTQTDEALGTPRYMSPEQALGRRTPLDGRTDVYSLGATLYELLTLATPFPGDDRLDTLAPDHRRRSRSRHERSTRESPSSSRRSCSRRWPRSRPTVMRRPPIWPTIWAASLTTGRSALAGRAFSTGPASGRAGIAS